MANKMLIDAAHPEETRVVVLRGNRIEDFDFEAANKKQLRGNIYLAKVTRVEPSLQAAFIEYGGNRHGFLAFSEIHPDYYQIPISDRQALMQDEEQGDGDDEPAEEERRPRRSRRRRGDRHAPASRRDRDETISEEVEAAPLAAREDTTGEPHDEATGPADGGDDHVAREAPGEAPLHEEFRPVELAAEQTPPYDDPTAELIEHASQVHGQAEAASPVAEPATADQAATPIETEVVDAGAESVERPAAEAATSVAVEVASAEGGEGELVAALPTHGEGGDQGRAAPGEDERDEHDEDEDEGVEQLGGDALEEVPQRAYRPRRQYKIQEVIKRRQILLVQVVKEERGNKGAALTTYLSLAGRYSVLMPNTNKGGGISRKITDSADRQRLKSIAQELEVPEGMGVILRTAGASRSKPEVKRDFEYLMRMWETVRETTMQSSAPALVYEEGSLIKRSIRDLYNKDIDEVVVSGETAYREAKDFMRLLMPSHARNVQLWRDPAPIFTKAGAEAQLDAMFSAQVTLRSGGYLVINQTEALVAIDVNSGRATREHNIEDTALRTNLEAADEIARQLRLRDLAGLIVVDFIDMEEGRNNRAVEKRIKDALEDDRARIQVGRISHFGLLEMSRQRIRTGVLEGSTVVCEHCAGAGMVRSTSSIALHVLRLLEDALISDDSHDVTVKTRGAVAFYILNQKRAHLAEIEGRFGVAVTFEPDEHLTGTSYCGLERGEPASGIKRAVRPILVEEPEPEEPLDEVEDALGDADLGGDERAEGDDNGESRRRRRRRRGRGRDRESSGISESAAQPSDEALALIGEEDAPRLAVSGDEEDEQRDDGAEGDERQSRRRRSRRGGRRTRGGRDRGEVGGEDLSMNEASVGAVAAEGDPMAPAMVAEEANVSASSDPEDAAPSAGNDVFEAERPRDDVAASVEPVSDATGQDEKIGGTPPTLSDPAPEPEPAEAGGGVPAAEPAGSASTQTRARPEPTSSELDPSRPKRSGWWQRAKASLGG